MAGALVFCLNMSKAAAQDPEPAATEKTAFVIAAVTEFTGIKTFSIVTPAEMITLKKSIPRINEAGRKAFTKIRRDWYETHTPPPQPQQQPQQTPATVANVRPGAVVVDMRTTTTTQQPKAPPFPLKLLPVKEVRELETCATEELANERIKFYEEREAELLKKKSSPDNPFGTTAFSGAGSSSGFASKTTQRKDSAPKTPTIDPAIREEVMQQFIDEVEKVLSGVADDTPKAGSKGPTRKEGLGTGTGNTFKGSTFGSKK